MTTRADDERVAGSALPAPAIAADASEPPGAGEPDIPLPEVGRRVMSRP